MRRGGDLQKTRKAPAPRQQAKLAEGVPARRAAMALLKGVLEDGRPLDQGFEAATRSLDARDRGFARNLCATTLRWLIRIDLVLGRFLDRKPSGRAMAALHLLRLGTAQLLYLDGPPHAVVSASVNTARAIGLDRQTGMINAILRRVDREGRAVLDGFDPDPLRDVPRFFRESWKQAYGAETASAIAGASLAQAPLDVHLKQPTQGTTDWATTLSATPLPQAAMLRVDPGAEVPPVPQMAGFDDGAWWIQDMAASLPVQLLGDLADQEMLDLCAAPGGKTLQAAARGAKVTALDRSENRLKAVRENLARCGLEAEVIAAEAQDWEPEDPEKRFARILLDAPCSATGTLRRHPDALWLKDKMTVAALSDVQAALLDRAADLLGPDGVLVYCVCSLQPEEGAAQVEAFLARADGQIVREPLKPEDLGLSDPDLAAALITADGDLRSFPFHLAERGGMDGFYAAKLRRIP